MTFEGAMMCISHQMRKAYIARSTNSTWRQAAAEAGMSISDLKALAMDAWAHIALMTAGEKVPGDRALRIRRAKEIEGSPDWSSHF